MTAITSGPYPVRTGMQDKTKNCRRGGTPKGEPFDFWSAGFVSIAG